MDKWITEALAVIREEWKAYYKPSVADTPESQHTMAVPAGPSCQGTGHHSAHTGSLAVCSYSN